ncbi:MBL fold metallo-hydrolase [Tropicimonas sp. S265A]|uniref:MBL fold metallo-hydrolase n=1 Tax=Tropicimonas sp. S265A TaxID=3415134 RepID=UPI003C7B6BE5
MPDDTRPGFAPLQSPVESPPAQGTALEIAPGILWMRLPLPMALDHVNVYALDEGDSWTLIDTGIASRRSRALWADLLAGPLGGKPIARVLVTHHHPDHVGLAGWFMEQFGCELLMTRTAWLMARMLQLDEQNRPAPETLAFWHRNGMDPHLLEQRKAERPFNFADTVAPLPLGFTRIAEGDVLTLGERSWTVRIGNGHAPEHATLWCEEDGLVLGGDQLLATISPNLGVYVTEPDADPVSDWLESCERFKAFAREDHLVLPGHKLPFTGLPMRLRQLADNHHSALQRLEAFLSEPRRAPETFPLLFKRTISDQTYGLAFVEAVAHLNHLHKAGRISRRADENGVWLWQAPQSGAPK